MSEAEPSVANGNDEIDAHGYEPLIHAKQRATQNDHDEVAKAAGDLLERLDAKRS